MTALEVLVPGPATTWQDGGRWGAARWGVPRSGPVDVLAHRLAARLAGASAEDVRSTVALEVGPGTAVLTSRAGPLQLAITGAAAVEVDGTPVATPAVVDLAADARCSVTSASWAYVVPAAAVELPAVLGSRSRHPRSGLGPALAAGDRVQLHDVRAVRPGARRPRPARRGPIGVLVGPQPDEGVLEVLTSAEFRTTTAFDRMGHRLDGPPLHHADGHDIVSDGIVAGAVQVPGDGRPWILTADHQTTGGYPKPAVVAAADLTRFVRLRPGAPVRFELVTVAEARARLRADLAAVEECVTGPVTPTAASLARTNLVGGVTDGRRGTS